MKFTTTVKALKSALESIDSCVPSKPLQPILAGIKIEATADFELVLTAYNLAEGMQVTCEADIISEGAIVILEKDLSALLKKISGDIEIEVIDLTVKIATQYSKIELQGLDASEYPDLSFDLSDTNGCIDDKFLAKSFSEAIDKCLTSVSNDANKHLLQGINIKTTAIGDVLQVASTDGHRLTICKIPHGSAFGSVTIPANFLSNLPKTSQETIDVSIVDNQIAFTSESSSICRLYDGIYPDYNLLLPKEFTRKLTVHRAQLIELLGVAEIAAESNIIELKLKASELSIHSSRDAAKAISTMHCEIVGNMINIGFNLKYLMQGLKMFDDEKVTFNINGALEPITIVSADEFVTHMIMPIQIRN